MFPFTSVIIVNYNGVRYLPPCLGALREQTYPSDRFEVIVSDNGSTDGSLELLRANYPWVRVLANRRNLGFASGNNVAIRITQGEYVVLLNNDTIPSPMWLENLVSVAESHPQAGMVTGHLQLFYDQLVLTFQTETRTPGNRDHRELGVQVFEVDSGTPGGVCQYLEGFYGWEIASTGQRFRWMGRAAKLGVPVPRGDGEWQIRFRLAAGIS
ncbi:MAG: glycosyltransferase family 2 protein, partial [Anaerolineae bacterium]|nr:glycosyltransferase family 2 protein [Anaerolineae bacterium]